MTDSLAPVGRIVKTHGIKGEVKLLPYLESPEHYKNFEVVFLKFKGGENAKFFVQGLRFHKGHIILKLKGCDSIEDAQKLVGLEVEIPILQLPQLPEGEFYWHNIQGLTVCNENGIILGKVEEILPTGSNDVLVVRKEDQELLLPAIKEVVLKVDLQEGKMTVRLQEWL